MGELFAEELAQFKEPIKRGRRIPYILFAKNSKTHVPTAGGQYEERDAVQLHCLDCSNCQGQEAVVSHYLKKGFKILKWQFPQGDAVKEYLGMFGPGNHFASLEEYCKLMSGLSDRKNADLKAHNDALQAKIDEYEKQAKKKGAGNEQRA